MKLILRRYDINGAWTHDQKEAFEYPPENSMWRVHRVIGFEATVTLKIGESYHTKTYEFESKAKWDKWVKARQEDHTNGKIIGIHHTVEYERKNTKKTV